MDISIPESKDLILKTLPKQLDNSERKDDENDNNYPDLSPTTPYTSPSKKTENVEAAVIKYYKLKGDYNKKYKNAKKKITKSGLSLSQIRKKLANMQMKCINCKQNGGTIFTNNNRILQAKCGNVTSPCALDLQIKRGKWMLLTKAAILSRDDMETTKADIIDLKLDLLFGIRTEEQIAGNFEEYKRSYKSLYKQLDLIEGVIESHNKIAIGDEANGEEIRNIPMKEFLSIKNAQLNNQISDFKKLIREYTEEDDVSRKQDLMQRAINIYVDDIKPLMLNIRENKYAVTMMDKTEDKGMFIVKRVKTLLKNIDFEYDFGEIISDKK